MTRPTEDIIASADTLLRIFKDSGGLRHEGLIREMRDALVRERVREKSEG